MPSKKTSTYISAASLASAIAIYSGGVWTGTAVRETDYPNPIDGFVVKQVYTDNVRFIPTKVISRKDTIQDTITQLPVIAYRDTFFISDFGDTVTSYAYEAWKDTFIVKDIMNMVFDTLEVDTLVSPSVPQELDLPPLDSGKTRICRIFDMASDSTLKSVREVSYRATPELYRKYGQVQVNVKMYVQSYTDPITIDEVDE